jgi:hypothetical protein
MKNEKDIFDFIKAKKVDVPDQAYFAALANSITDSKKNNIVPIYKRPVFWLSSAAAAIVIVFVALNFGETNVMHEKPLLAMNDLDTEIVYDYVNENINDFDAEMISEFIPTEVITSNTTEIFEVELEEVKTIETEELSFEDISTEDILNYFESEEISLSDFEDELFI